MWVLIDYCCITNHLNLVEWSNKFGFHQSGFWFISVVPMRVFRALHFCSAESGVISMLPHWHLVVLIASWSWQSRGFCLEHVHFLTVCCWISRYSVSRVPIEVVYFQSASQISFLVSLKHTCVFLFHMPELWDLLLFPHFAWGYLYSELSSCDTRGNA